MNKIIRQQIDYLVRYIDKHYGLLMKAFAVRKAIMKHLRELYVKGEFDQKTVQLEFTQESDDYTFIWEIKDKNGSTGWFLYYYRDHGIFEID